MQAGCHICRLNVQCSTHLLKQSQHKQHVRRVVEEYEAQEEVDSDDNSEKEYDSDGFSPLEDSEDEAIRKAHDMTVFDWEMKYKSEYARRKEMNPFHTGMLFQFVSYLRYHECEPQKIVGSIPTSGHLGHWLPNQTLGAPKLPK